MRLTFLLRLSICASGTPVTQSFRQSFGLVIRFSKYASILLLEPSTSILTRNGTPPLSRPRALPFLLRAFLLRASGLSGSSSSSMERPVTDMAQASALTT